MWLILEKFLRTSEETRGYSKKNYTKYFVRTGKTL